MAYSGRLYIIYMINKKRNQLINRVSIYYIYLGLPSIPLVALIEVLNALI